MTSCRRKATHFEGERGGGPRAHEWGEPARAETNDGRPGGGASGRGVRSRGGDSPRRGACAARAGGASGCLWTRAEDARPLNCFCSGRGGAVHSVQPRTPERGTAYVREGERPRAVAGAKFRAIRVGRGFGLGTSRHLTGTPEGRRPLCERTVQIDLEGGVAPLGGSPRRLEAGWHAGGCDRVGPALTPAAGEGRGIVSRGPGAWRDRPGAEPGTRGRGLAVRLGRWRTAGRGRLRPERPRGGARPRPPRRWERSGRLCR